MNPPQNKAMRQALENHVILQQIFKNDSVSGKTARLVSHFWNEVLLSLPQPKLRLSLQQSEDSEEDYCYATEFQEFSIKMEKRLAKCASVNECRWTGHYTGHYTPALKFCASKSLLYFTNKFSDFIEDLIVNFIDEGSMQAWNPILQYCCLNLKRLEIYSQSAKLSNTNHDPTTPLPIRHKLTFLKIYDSTHDSDFLEVTQLILSSAQKLTHFTYHGKKYPDLSRNKEIKWIKVDTCDIYATRVPSCSGVYGLNKMLDQVKDHLQFLHLKNEIGLASPHNHVNDLNMEASQIDFQIPKMKNLKEFRNDMIDWFSCGDQLQDICTENMPNLETLRLIKFDSNLDDILQNVVQNRNLFSGLKNLHVANVNDPKSVIGLRTPFPNLQSLTFQRFGIWWESPLLEVGEHLQACAPLGLKHLKLDILSRSGKVSEFIYGFSNCEEVWSCLKILEIRLLYRLNYDLDGVEGGEGHMEKWLLRMKELQKVTITGIGEPWPPWVESFIQENQIPIIIE